VGKNPFDAGGQWHHHDMVGIGNHIIAHDDSRWGMYITLLGRVKVNQDNIAAP
jgi:hypothetical protein